MNRVSEALIKEGAIIESDNRYYVQSADESAQIVFRLDPEYYRQIDKATRSMLHEKGRLEVLQLNAGGGGAGAEPTAGASADVKLTVVEAPVTAEYQESTSTAPKYSKQHDIDNELMALNSAMDADADADAAAVDSANSPTLPIKARFESLFDDDDDDDEDEDEEGSAAGNAASPAVDEDDQGPATNSINDVPGGGADPAIDYVEVRQEDVQCGSDFVWEDYGDSDIEDISDQILQLELASQTEQQQAEANAPLSVRSLDVICIILLDIM